MSLTVAGGHTPEVIIGETPEAYKEHLKNYLEEILKKLLSAHGIVSVGVSGGSMPQLIVPILFSIEGLNWRRIRLFMIKLRQELQPEMIGLRQARYDLLLLGMGPDGHTASLFPNSRMFKHQEAGVIAVDDSPKPPPKRITLSANAINNAKNVAFLITGEEKAEVLKAVLDGDLRYPAAGVRPISNKLKFIIDKPAASKIQATRKRQFFNKKNAVRFRLLPGGGAAGQSSADGKDVKGRFIPTEQQLEEQHECGVFFDDDYDYMQHLRSAEDKAEMVAMEMEPVPPSNVKVQKMLPPPMPSFLFGGLDSMKSKKEPALDPEVENLLLGGEAEEELEDDFLQLAGGALDSTAFSFREADEYDSAEDEEEYIERLAYRSGARYEYSGFDDDQESEEEDDKVVHRDPVAQRDIDQGFEQFMDHAYGSEQIGGLEHDDPRMQGVLDPNNPRIIKLISRQKGLPEYDPEYAKEDVRKRIRNWKEEDKEETEMVEVDEGASKRLKWDCESFTTQYSNIYNRPTQIREAPGKLSKKALRRLQAAEPADTQMDEDCEMMDDDESVISTVSTLRPKGETPEERRARKAAIKEVQRERRAEKKMNKTAFAEAAQRFKQDKLNAMKYKPMA
ncbi:unnamed protein product, partial [Mesorhabditis spiculigera]